VDIQILKSSKYQEIFLKLGIPSKSTVTLNDISYYKILLALSAIERGSDLMDVCKLICWKDFELFSSEILKFHNFKVLLNYRLRNPTRQIDVVGTKSGLALIIDCKHWRKNSYSLIRTAVKKQKERGQLLSNKKSLNGVSKVFPIIVTFIPSEYRQVDMVPIIPIQLLNSFLLEFEFYIKQYFII
jgi:hypothetical protein